MYAEVARVEAADADEGPNGVVRYALRSVAPPYPPGMACTLHCTASLLMNSTMYNTLYSRDCSKRIALEGTRNLRSGRLTHDRRFCAVLYIRSVERSFRFGSIRILRSHLEDSIRFDSIESCVMIVILLSGKEAIDLRNRGDTRHGAARRGAAEMPADMPTNYKLLKNQ